VHGPGSGDNARVIEGLFRSEYGVDAFAAADPTSSVVPLWCDEASQIPFGNAEQQIESRWVLDLHCQITPSIGTNQQFAQYLQATLIEVDASYPPIPAKALTTASGQPLTTGGGAYLTT
jgi:hypothetical protein